MIDRDKVRQKIFFMEENLRLLKEMGCLSLDEFKENHFYFPASVRCLQVAIEAMIDIASHIVAKLRLGMLKNYSDAFEILGKNDIVPKDFLPVLIKMVRFRNRVVHLYDTVDEDEVYNIIKNNLGDFERFISIIVDKLFK